MHTGLWSEDLTNRDPLEDLGINGRNKMGVQEVES